MEDAAAKQPPTEASSPSPEADGPQAAWGRFMAASDKPEAFAELIGRRFWAQASKGLEMGFRPQLACWSEGRALGLEGAPRGRGRRGARESSAERQARRDFWLALARADGGGWLRDKLLAAGRLTPPNDADFGGVDPRSVRGMELEAMKKHWGEPIFAPLWAAEMELAAWRWARPGGLQGALALGANAFVEPERRESVKKEWALALRHEPCPDLSPEFIRLFAKAAARAGLVVDGERAAAMALAHALCGNWEIWAPNAQARSMANARKIEEFFGGPLAEAEKWRLAAAWSPLGRRAHAGDWREAAAARECLAALGWIPERLDWEATIEEAFRAEEQDLAGRSFLDTAGAESHNAATAARLAAETLADPLAEARARAARRSGWPASERWEAWLARARRAGTAEAARGWPDNSWEELASAIERIALSRAIVPASGPEPAEPQPAAPGLGREEIRPRRRRL